MREIPHWSQPHSIRVAESASGVLVTTTPKDNLVRAPRSPWPCPELLQKFSASGRFRGATAEDDAAARSGLGHYCDLQSLNSEDAVTWSAFGNLAYLESQERLGIVNRLFRTIGEEGIADTPTCWLWRRLPHPEKPESNNGPEIDFAFLSRNTLVLGEAKWNSPLGRGQGINRDRSQLDLRIQYCEKLAPLAMPHVKRFIVLGVGRATSSVFSKNEMQSNTNVKVCALTWHQVAECFESKIGDELIMYLRWKEINGGKHG